MSSNFKIFILLLSMLLLLSCSSSRELQSTFFEGPTSDIDALQSWITQNAERHNYDGLIYYIVNDRDYLYAYLIITNPGFARDAYRYGITTYFDKDFRRSYGLTFPTGILFGLSDFPGARKGFLENPSWENVPENRELVRTAERMMPEQAKLMQRRDRRADRSPARLPVSHLEAQGLKMHFDNSGRHPELLLRIPLEITRDQQFSLDVKPGQVIQFGVEVSPPELEEIERDDYMPDASDRFRQSQSRQMQQQRSLANMLRGGFTFWTEVRLAE